MITIVISGENIYWAILSIIDFVAALLNALLIYLALFRSPSMARRYSILIINMAATDCLSASLNFFTKTRLIPARVTLAYVHNGPCKLIGEPVCYIAYNTMAHLIVHSNYSLLLSFAYRYYVLLFTEPTQSQLLLVLLLTYAPSFIQLVLYQIAKGDRIRVIQLINEQFPDYDFRGMTVSGIESILKPCAFFKIFQMTAMAILIYILILIIRQKIINKLMFKNVTLSVTTKMLHSQLLKALTYQALIPVTYSISLTMFLVETFGIYSSEAFENYIMSGLVIIPLLSPITSFVFFSPYKRFIKNTTRRVFFSNVVQTNTVMRNSIVTGNMSVVT